jgi:hypothetical protein
LFITIFFYFNARFARVTKFAEQVFYSFPLEGSQTKEKNISAVPLGLLTSPLETRERVFDETGAKRGKRISDLRAIRSSRLPLYHPQSIAPRPLSISHELSTYSSVYVCG